MNKKNYKFRYECNDCGKIYSEDEVKYLCPDCKNKNNTNTPPKGLLKVIYDYKKIKNSLPENLQDKFEFLKQRNYMDLLPIKNLKSLPKLRIGNTPIYKIKFSSDSGFKTDKKSKNFFNLYLKDDSQNPTFSFKDRASAIVSAYAKEKNYNTIITASTGNAGSSLAGICASQKQKSIITVPETAPKAKLTQMLMYGATVIPVKGTYDDAFDLSIKASEKFGWYNRNTAYNPLTVEGKKTVSFELYEQIKIIPDKIFVPVGDGVIISAVYKGFEDLLKLGIIKKIPVIVAVQSEKSNNLINNINKSKFISRSSNTIADSISVNIPRNFYATQKYINKYKGEFLSVSDDEIIKASGILSQNTGIFTEPAAAASFAGFLTYNKKNKIADFSNNIVLLTGSGLKDLASVRSLLNLPKAINPKTDFSEINL